MSLSDADKDEIARLIKGEVDNLRLEVRGVEASRPALTVRRVGASLAERPPVEAYDNCCNGCD